MESAEDSLRRLQTDYIDLYQSHTEDPETPLEETMRAYADLIEQGKVRAIGASNYTPQRLEAAIETSAKLGLPRYESLQPQYNLYDRSGYEQALEPLCLKHGIGVIPYYGLASGFLTGKYRTEADKSKSPRGETIIKKYLNDRGQRILHALDHVAADHGSTPASVALAWLIARPGITAPIASATTPDQLQDLFKAVDLQLDTSAIETLNQASA
jgi:aryl-alcohol dehydrogenase-like predicted oxidoreductase